MSVGALRISTKDMDRAAWHDQRRGLIGSSDASAIAGVNTYKNKTAVWLEKTGQMPDPPENDQNEFIFWGNILEDVVARVFAQRTGFKVQRDNCIRIHPKYKFIGCNLDRVMYHPEYGRGVLEIKTTGEWMRKEWDGDEVPDAYYIQVQHQLLTTGWSYGYLAVLIGGNKFRYYLVERNDELIKHLLQLEIEFWLLVQGRVLPEMDGSDAATAVLSKMYPQSEEGKLVYLPEEAGEMFIRYDRVKEQLKVIEEGKAELENKLKVMIGEAEEARFGDRKITWKTVTSKRLDTKTLKVEDPAIYDKYAIPNVSRRFLVT